MPRDYYDEIESVLQVEPADWSVKKLSLWQDRVEKPTSQSMEMVADDGLIAEKEEEAEMATFAALKSKIAKLDWFIDLFATK